MILGNNNVCLMNMSYGHTIMVYVICIMKCELCVSKVIPCGIIVVGCRVLNYAVRPYMTLSVCELPIA